MTDAQLIELIRTNHHDKAFSALYKYFPVVKKMVLANDGKTEDAEDLYQEALIVFYNKVNQPGFTLTASINTYLYSICRYMWKDQLKKKQKNSFTDIETTLIPLVDNEFSSEVEHEDQFKKAEKVITDLGERCRELLMLFYFHSLKLKDIAKKMGYNSENTAKNQKYKCLESAKLKLKALKNI